MPRTFELEPNTIYISITANEDELHFWSFDTLDKSSKNSIALAALARGMIEYGRNNQVEAVTTGRDLLVDENVIERQDQDNKEMVKTASGLIIPFPKTIGTA